MPRDHAEDAGIMQGALLYNLQKQRKLRDWAGIELEDDDLGKREYLIDTLNFLINENESALVRAGVQFE
jgi:hypothetical protein